MIRTPYTTNRLLDTAHWFRDSLQLLSASISQKLSLLEDLFLLQIPHTDGFLAAIDVVADDDWVFSWSRGDVDLDLRVCRGELLERITDEGVHAFRGSHPVAVMEVESFTLENE